MVTPGFIDGHTHMDAQVFWDATGSQLVLARRDLGGHGQLRLHPGPGPHATSGRWWCATSSGPRTSTRPRWPPGIDWSFETFPEYLDAVDRLPKGINFAANIGHSALRTWAMGERAFEEEATDDDLALMEGQLAESLAGRGHRVLHLAHRAPRDLRQPPGGLAAGVVGRGGPRWSGSWAASGRGIFEGADGGMSSPDPEVRARGPRPDEGAGRRQPGAHDLRPGGHPGVGLPARLPRRGGRRRGPDDRPDPLPGHLGPAVAQDQAALRPAPGLARPAGPAGRGAAAGPRPIPSGAARYVDAAVDADYGRWTGVGAQARPPDFEGIRVYQHGLPPNPSVADVGPANGACTRPRP